MEKKLIEAYIKDDNIIFDYKIKRELDAWLIMGFKYGGKISALIIVISTLFWAVLRCVWYFYMLGKFKVFNISYIYIDTRSENIVFQILGFTGIVILFIFSNITIYKFGDKEYSEKIKFVAIKKIFWIMLVIFIEMIVVLGFVIVNSNISFLEFQRELSQLNRNEIWRFICQLFLIIIMVNFYGINMIIFKKIRKYIERRVLDKINRDTEKQTKENNNEEKDTKAKGKLTSVIKSASIIILITCIIEIVIIYTLGIKDAYGQRDFKVIYREKNVTREEAEKNNTIFMSKEEEFYYTCYPIVYENSNIYIISRLFENDGEIKIEYDYQEIIQKDNVKTARVGDVTRRENLK